MRLEGNFEEINLGEADIATLYRSYKEILDLLPEGIGKFNVWFGGGCYVRKFLGEKMADVDFFGADREELAKFVWHLRKHGYKLFFANRNAIKGYIDTHRGRVNVDIIKLLFEDEIQTIKNFDFSVSKIVTNPKTSKGYYYMSTPFDILQKRLVIPHELTTPLGTFKRFYKYVGRGFKACDGTILTIAKAVGSIDFENPGQNMIEFYPNGSKSIPLWD